MIPLFKVSMAPEAGALMTETLYSGFIGQGPKVEQFEAALRDWFNWDYAATLNSGTSALHLALHLMKAPGVDAAGRAWPGLQPGDEILTTPLTCTATNWPIFANGLSAAWVDVDPDDLNLDLDDLERRIGPNTRGVIAVHWGGYSIDMERLDAILDRAAERWGVRPFVLEDCAHAWGAKRKGKLVGTDGRLAAFSFQAIKHFTTGDGGCLLLPNAELNRRARLARWYGIDRDRPTKDFRCEEDVAEWGFKFHMNDLAASIGLANLPLSRQVIAAHRANAAYYNQRLAGVPGVRLTQQGADRDSSYWIYTLRVERRDDFVRKLTEAGVMVSRVHERNDKHSVVAELRRELPGVDAACASMICIPVGWWVTEEQRAHIADTIRAGW